jgi:hypothetical protein
MLSKFQTSTKLLLILLVFILQGALSACGSNSDNNDDDPLVSSDASKVYVTQSGSVTVSGVIVDAVKRTLISGASVTIRVDGNSYTVTSAPTSHASPGSFAFLLTPGDSEYFITVTTSDTYAPYFYANTTPKTSTTSGGIGTQDIGSVEMYTAIDTTVSVKNISGGIAITGLTLYYDTKDVAEANSTETVSISGVDIVATETAGVYSFPLPDNGVDYAIKVKELVDDADVAYDPYNATITDDVLTSLQSGDNGTYYMKASDPKQFTIYLHLVDEDGHAFDAGDVLVLNETGENDAIYAERSATVTNEYILTTTAPTFDFTILNIDLNGDGVNDTATAQLTTLDETTNVLDSGSFDANREATVVVPITLITADQNIAAELLSGADQFQVNGTAEVIIAFDRPVEIVHEVRMQTQALNKLTTIKAIEDPALVYENDATTLATTIAGETSVPLNANNTQYDYLDDASAAQVTSALADTSGDTTSPYEHEFDSAASISVVPAASYVFSANNTLLTITLDSATITNNQEYVFEFAVRGILSDTPVAFVSKTLLAKSDDTITQLDELSVDNMDYLDTTTKDLLDATAEQNFTNQSDHDDLFFTLPLATYDNTNSAFIRYLTYALTTAGFDSMPAGIYLISPVKLSGTVEVVSQTEKYLDSGAVVTETYSTLGDYYGLDYTSDSGIVAGDLDLASLTNISSDAKYLMDIPSNHGVDESGLKTVLGTVLEDTADELADTTTVVTSGANITTELNDEGVYFLYTIPISAQSGGYLTNVTLDFNVSVNGTNVTGNQSYIVQ